MAMARMSDAERWERIWRGAEEAVARLLTKDAPSEEEDELAPVVELRPVEDEPEGES
jgi:hypothetical protein